MCLCVKDKEPRIAKSDIMVMKYLNYKNNKYYSPVQGTPVKLNKVMTAQPDSPQIEYFTTDSCGRDIFCIGGGVFHASLTGTGRYGHWCVKAVIPKGAEYWVDPFGTEIAATKMLITKEVPNIGMDNTLAKELLETAPEINGVRAGDYLMTDNSFVHPTEGIAEAKVRGVVCGFARKEPVICALEKFEHDWDSECFSRIGKYTSWKKSIKCFNGREVTAGYRKQVKEKDKTRFGAFEKCINYRKEQNEEWYLGSSGENLIMFDNALYLNAARCITGIGFLISAKDWYWTCTEDSSPYSWACYHDGVKIYGAWVNKNAVCYVVPFFDFKKESK